MWLSKAISLWKSWQYNAALPIPFNLLNFFHEIFIFMSQLVNPNNKDIRDIPGLAPPAMTRKLLWSASWKFRKGSSNEIVMMICHLIGWNSLACDAAGGTCFIELVYLSMDFFLVTFLQSGQTFSNDSLSNNGWDSLASIGSGLYDYFFPDWKIIPIWGKLKNV